MSILEISNHSSGVLIILLSCVLFEEYIDILVLEVASPGNRLCAICVGTLSFPIVSDMTQLPHQ